MEEATSTGSTSQQLSQWCSFWGASCRSSTTNGFQNVAYCLTAASGRNNSRNFEASAIFLFTWDRCGYRSARSHQKTFSTCETVARMKWCESRSYCSFCSTCAHTCAHYSRWIFHSLLTPAYVPGLKPFPASFLQLRPNAFGPNTSLKRLPQRLSP